MTESSVRERVEGAVSKGKRRFGLDLFREAWEWLSGGTGTR